MEVATTLAAPGPEPRQAAAAAVAPDPLTAELLEKHSAGVKLTPKEYGKLGAFKARLKGVFAGKGSKNGGGGPVSPPAASQAAKAGPLVGPDQTPMAGQAGPVIDPDLVRRTTAAILQTCDGIARTYIGGEARKAGADPATLAEFQAAVALQPGPRDLMVNTSPEVAAALGLDATNYPIAAFCTGLGIWSTSLFLAVNKLQALQLERAKREKPVSEASEKAKPAEKPHTSDPAALP